MKFNAKITQISEARNGVSRNTGLPFTAIDIVLAFEEVVDADRRFIHTIQASYFIDGGGSFPYQLGTDVEADINFSTQVANGRVFNRVNLRALRPLSAF